MDPNEERKVDLFITIVVTLILLLCAINSCRAQKPKATYDTIPCHTQCIVKTTTVMQSGKPKTYIVYKCTHTGIQEIIPVSQTVMTYITVCRQNGIAPSLAIRLRNGEVSSIIKYKKKWKRLN